MKKIISLLLSLALLCTVTACQSNKKALTEEEQLLKMQGEAFWQVSYGKLQMQQNLYMEASSYFTNAIKLYPTAEAYLLRAEAYRLQNGSLEDLESALSDYETALAMDSTLEDGWVELAKLHSTMGNHEQAIEVTERGLQALPQSEKLSALLQELPSA